MATCRRAVVVCDAGGRLALLGATPTRYSAQSIIPTALAGWFTSPVMRHCVRASGLRVHGGTGRGAGWKVTCGASVFVCKSAGYAATLPSPPSHSASGRIQESPELNSTDSNPEK